MLEQIFEEVNIAITSLCKRIDIKQAIDDTYPEYRATGVQLGLSMSTPACIPSGSTLGHAGMGSTGAHQSAGVSTRQTCPSGDDQTNTQALRRSRRKM